jgi:hypothetical protein
LATAVAVLAGCAGETSREDRGPPEPESGKVTVTSHPNGAAVLLDGHRRVGRTPLTLERPAFTRLELSLVKEGYKIYRTTTTVEPGGHTRIRGSLVKEQAFLVVRSGVVRGAKIVIDGQRRGRTPNKLKVEAGRPLTVEVSDQGFKTFRTQVKLVAGETRDLDAFLVPEGKRPGPVGWLTVEADELALVQLGSTPLGSTPLTRVPLRARRYRLRVTSQDKKRSRTMRVRIKANEEHRVKVKLKRR